MTATFWCKNKNDVLQIILVESITVGYRQSKMVHELQFPGRQSNLEKEQLYWIVYPRGDKRMELPMSNFELEKVEE